MYECTPTSRKCLQLQTLKHIPNIKTDILLFCKADIFFTFHLWGNEQKLKSLQKYQWQHPSHQPIYPEAKALHLHHCRICSPTRSPQAEAQLQHHSVPWHSKGTKKRNFILHFFYIFNEEIKMDFEFHLSTGYKWLHLQLQI